MSGRGHLQLIPGGRRDCIQLGSLVVIAAPKEEPPFSPEAVIVEEDTFLVLSAPPEVRAAKERPIELFQALWALDEVPCGTITVREGKPLRVLAVVHDLAREPSITEADVKRALDAAMLELSRRNVRRVALQLVGAVHGGLGEQQSLALITRALDGATALESVWLMVSRERTHGVIEMLEELRSGARAP